MASRGVAQTAPPALLYRDGCRCIRTSTPSLRRSSRLDVTHRKPSRLSASQRPARSSTSAGLSVGPETGGSVTGRTILATSTGRLRHRPSIALRSPTARRSGHGGLEHAIARRLERPLRPERRHAVVSTPRTAVADTPVAFRQAYEAGKTIVATPGVVMTGLSCRIRYPQPARTAIGMANGGRNLILAVVTDHPGTTMHGLDASQMSKLMVELGAAHAYLLDGSGSSEMIARMPSTGRLSLRNYPADGAERTMPVGLGIFRS